MATHKFKFKLKHVGKDKNFKAKQLFLESTDNSKKLKLKSLITTIQNRQ